MMGAVDIAIGAVNPLLGMAAHSVDWSKLARGMAEGVAQQLPVNMGMFLGTIAGDRTPVTEKQFDSETLQALRAAAAKGLGDHAQRVKSAQWMYDRAKSGDSWEMISRNGKLVEVPQEVLQAKAYANLVKAQLHRPSIQYDNYERSPTGDILNDESWLQGVAASFRDPTWRAMTSVGRANLETDQHGNVVVVDNYDWNNRKALRNGLSEDPAGTIGMFLSALAHPTQVGNVIGTIFAPQEYTKRPVRLNLGMVKPK